MPNSLDQRIRESFHDSIYGSHEIFFRSESVMKFIDWCDENDIRIIGIEGFELKNGSIIPRNDLIADFSSATRKGESWQECRDRLNKSARNFFLDNKIRDLMFNFTLQERP